MKNLSKIFFLPLLIALGSCSSVKVVVDSNEKVDFTRYTTFSFHSWQDLDKEMFSEGDKKMMEDAFIREFEQRGFREVNSTGDMQVSIYVVVNEETAFSGYSDYVGGRNAGYSHYMGGWGYGYNGNTSKQQGKLMGTLIMNVYDGKSKDQIWQAIASGAVNEDFRTRDKTIPQKVSAIMRQFPIRPK